MSIQAEVVHHIPGRVRVHVPHLRGRPKACSAISTMAGSIPGVHRIDANPVTGSLLVQYDQHDAEVKQRLAATLKDLDSLLRLIDPELAEMEDSEARLADEVKRLMETLPMPASLRTASDDLDRRVRELTHGHVGLAMLLPLLLAASAYALLDDKRSPMLLGGLVALSLHSLVNSDAASGAPDENPSRKSLDA